MVFVWGCTKIPTAHKAAVSFVAEVVTGCFVVPSRPSKQHGLMNSAGDKIGFKKNYRRKNK